MYNPTLKAGVLVSIANFKARRGRLCKAPQKSDVIYHNQTLSIAQSPKLISTKQFQLRPVSATKLNRTPLSLSTIPYFERFEESDPNVAPSCERVLKDIFLVTYETQQELSRAFLRFQEFYESPVFRQKYFTLEEFKGWYTRKFGRFTYETDWIGFNIPSSVFEEFEVGKMNPLSKEEITLMAILSSKPKPFYVIGSTTSALERHAQKLEFVEPHRVKMEASLVSDDKPQGLSSTLIHEISHGLYYLDPEYSRSVRNELGLLGEDINPLFQTLEHLGYHKEVWMDEAAAYLISECQSHPIMALNGIDIGEYPWCKLRNKLQELFSLAYVENLRTSN